MPIHIYNSLTRKKEELKPIKPNEINMYTCGVTVYDQCHIGHARSLYIFEVIRRYLEYRGFKVRFVRNITDIDDKIINRANELNVPWDELVAKYIASYKNDLEAMGIRAGVKDSDGEEPRATKNVEEIKKYIASLIDKGYAYVTDSGVYFSVRKFKDYGKLSGQSIDQMLSGVRKEADESKNDPLDFALWKRSKANEPFWPSPWGDGRPGWHIECSLMSQKYLQCDTLDIHAGGRDLIFPHHENEIAQSEAFSGKPFAKYWIHHGLLTINGQKMSKSLGNFVTIEEILKKCSADALKILYLQAHYSSPVDFSWERLEEAKKATQRFEILCQRIISIKMPASKSKGRIAGFVEERKKDFLEAMDDDFNTPRALSCLFDLVVDTNKVIDSGEKDDSYYATIDYAGLVLMELGKKVFGIIMTHFAEDGLTVEEANILYERGEDRKRKDYKAADEKRERLRKTRIIVEDTKDGRQVWRRE